MHRSKATKVRQEQLGLDSAAFPCENNLHLLRDISPDYAEPTGFVVLTGSHEPETKCTITIKSLFFVESTPLQVFLRL